MLLRGRKCCGPRRSTYSRPERLNRSMMFCVPPLISATSSSGPSPKPCADIQSATAFRSTPQKLRQAG